jgi:hypothetical protein
MSGAQGERGRRGERRGAGGGGGGSDELRITSLSGGCLFVHCLLRLLVAGSGLGVGTGTWVAAGWGGGYLGLFN